MNDTPPIQPRKHRRFHIGALIIVLILVFLLFKINLNNAVNSPTFNQNVTFIQVKTEMLWTNYVARPAIYIWNNLFSDWLKEGIQQVKEAIAPPPADQSQFDQVTKPDTVRKYFYGPDKETVDEYDSLSQPKN